MNFCGTYVVILAHTNHKRLMVTMTMTTTTTTTKTAATMTTTATNQESFSGRAFSANSRSDLSMKSEIDQTTAPVVHFPSDPPSAFTNKMGCHHKVAPRNLRNTLLSTSGS